MFAATNKISKSTSGYVPGRGKFNAVWRAYRLACTTARARRVDIGSTRHEALYLELCGYYTCDHIAAMRFWRSMTTKATPKLPTAAAVKAQEDARAIERAIDELTDAELQALIVCIPLVAQYAPSTLPSAIREAAQLFPHLAPQFEQVIASIGGAQ